MKYITAAEAATKWEISERSVRNYCAEGRVAGAMLFGKTWMIPEDTQKTHCFKISGEFLFLLKYYSI